MRSTRTSVSSHAASMATSADCSRPALAPGVSIRPAGGFLVFARARTASMRTSCPLARRSLSGEKVTHGLLEVLGGEGPAQKGVDPSFKRFVAPAVMGAEGDHGDLVERWFGLEPRKDLEAVLDAQREVEQHQEDPAVTQRVHGGGQPACLDDLDVEGVEAHRHERPNGGLVVDHEHPAAHMEAPKMRSTRWRRATGENGFVK